MLNLYWMFSEINLILDGKDSLNMKVLAL